MDSFFDEQVDQAKTILVEIVVRNSQNDKVASDKELQSWLKVRNNPDKKKKQVDDIVNIFKKLDEYDCVCSICEEGS